MYMYMWLDLQKPSHIAQELKFNLLLIIKPTLALALPRNIKHMAIDGWVCFHRRLFSDPVKSPWCTTGSVKPVNGINKDVRGARLLPTAVLTYPVDWVCFCYLLKTQHCCLYPNVEYNPTPLAHPTNPLLPAHSYYVPSLMLQSLWRKLLIIQLCYTLAS